MYKVMKSMFALLFILNLGSWASPVSAELLLFSGQNNKDFLGCYDCSKYDSGAICNKYGTYGSKYSSSSPWNKYSSSNDVPVLVDRSGNFYGYFTINSYRQNAFEQARQLKNLFEGLDGDLDKVRDIICD